MFGKKIVRGAVLALAVAAPMAVGAGTAHAAPGSDLDLTKCQIVDDPTNYGDGIDWYRLNYTYVNEGTAETGNFVMRARPVRGTDEFSGVLQNEASRTFTRTSLAAGQSRSGSFRVTKNVVDKRTWGIFLDINRTTGENQQQAADSFCSALVDNT